MGLRWEGVGWGGAQWDLSDYAVVTSGLGNVTRACGATTQWLHNGFTCEQCPRLLTGLAPPSCFVLPWRQRVRSPHL